MIDEVREPEAIPALKMTLAKAFVDSLDAVKREQLLDSFVEKLPVKQESVHPKSDQNFSVSYSQIPFQKEDSRSLSFSSNIDTRKRDLKQMHKLSPAWSATEDVLLDVALQRFGKDWTEISEFVGTRDIS